MIIYMKLKNINNSYNIYYIEIIKNIIYFLNNNININILVIKNF